MQRYVTLHGTGLLGSVLCCLAAFACCSGQTPTANPARPTVTNPATLPPVGYLQLEQGYVGSLGSPETPSQYGATFVAKETVYPRLMAEVQVQPWARSRQSDGAATASGDVLVGGQAVIYNAGRGQ